MLEKPTQSDLDRFFAKVDKLPNGCWFWLGARSTGKDRKYSNGRPRKPYGSFWYKGRPVRAHRFAVECIGDPPRECPAEHDRDHTCVFSLCVNPEHIEVVPKQLNHERKLERAADTTC